MSLAAIALWLLTDWSAAVKPLEHQVVRVEMRQGEASGTCSGAVINATHGYVLTAAHCVPEGDKGEFSMTVNRRDATVMRVNRILDLAVLKFTVKGEDAITLAPATPPLGSEVGIAGFAFGAKRLVVNFGHISTVLNDAGDGVWIDGMTIFGQSGGAVVDAEGRLVAVNSEIRYQGPAHLSQAVRVEDVADFVKSYLPSK